MNLTNKQIIITGAAGLVGIPLVRKCLEQGASKVYAVDIRRTDDLNRLAQEFPHKLSVIQKDLTYLDNCQSLFIGKKIDVVFHIAGVKGSPSRAAQCPADYLFPMLMFNTNMIKTSFDNNVGWFVYMSSVGVYQPADVMKEDDVWLTMPSKNDWYPGWTKRMGELTVESLQIQHNWKNWTIIRPANIYGIHDNFTQDATVIAANVWKSFDSKTGKIFCWGDGSPRRDFVFGDDVAQASIDVVDKEVNDIINFGSANAVSIKDTINIIVEEFKKATGKDLEIEWDSSKPNGDMLRCLDHGKQEKYGILPKTSLREGIRQTIENYIKLHS